MLVARERRRGDARRWRWTHFLGWLADGGELLDAEVIVDVIDIDGVDDVTLLEALAARDGTATLPGDA